MIRATLDTNVLVSGMAGLDVPSSAPGAILRRCLAGAFELVISDAIFTELERTLTKPYFRLRRPWDQIEAAVQSITRLAMFVEPEARISGVATHPEDDLVIGTAVSGNVAYLVTGDRMLLRIGVYQGVHLVTPSDFLDLLE